MKKFVLIIACLLLVAVCFTACKTTFSSDYGEEILSNGTFEGNSKDGWSLVADADESSTPALKSTTAGSDYAEQVGKYYLSITASEYSSYTQSVSIEKNSIYYLSAKVRIATTLTSDDSTLGGAFVAEVFGGG